MCTNGLFKTEKRYASIMMLAELLKRAQFITFNKIRRNKNTELFKSIISEKKPNLKKKGLELIDECIKEVSKRDRNEQSNMLMKIFNDIFKEKTTKNVDSDQNFGVAVVIKSLLSSAKKEVFEENFISICEFVNFLKKSKVQNNQLIVLEMYPILSNYNNELFNSHGYIDKAIEHLLQILDSQFNNLKKPAHHSLSKILDPYHPEKIKDKAKQILIKLCNEFKTSSIKHDTYLLPCMALISDKCHKFFTDIFTEEQIHDLVNQLLINGISDEVLSYLEFMLKIQLSDLTYIIQIKLLFTISFILTSKFYNFHILSDLPEKHKNSIREFKSNLERNLKGAAREINSESLICVSLLCLSRFKFSEFSDQMGSFVKENALEFLDDVRPPVRKAAARSVSLLNVKTSKSNFGLSHNVTSYLPR